MAHNVLHLTLPEITKNFVFRVRVAPSVTIRTRLACWLIGLAAKVLDVPCEVGFIRADEIGLGDVVQNVWDKVPMTVEALYATGRVDCVWFEGLEVRHGKGFPMRTLTKVNAV